jgi:hypothetical protein
MDSNHRPLPCQGSALTRLSYGPTSNDCDFNSNGRRAIRAMFGSRPQHALVRVWQATNVPDVDPIAEATSGTLRCDSNLSEVRILRSWHLRDVRPRSETRNARDHARTTDRSGSIRNAHMSAPVSRTPAVIKNGVIQNPR